MEPARTVLVSGLGGGLDIVNASLLFHAMRHDGRHTVRLGSVRHIDLNNISDHTAFADSGTLLKPTSSFQVRGRFIEPRIASILQEEVIYLSRNYGGAFDSARLRDAISRAREKFKFDDIIFVDGGGDSLILESSDANSGSETTDPFKGGDSELLASIVGMQRIYQAVIAVGLDIAPEAFKKNVELLRAAGGYFGRVNLRTGEKEDFTLGHLLAFKPGFLDRYFALASEVLVLQESQLKHAPKPGEAVERLPSHTGTVTYHALKGEFGRHRTFVPWEPRNAAGEKGVNVHADHCWMYFFDASKVEEVKLARNGRAAVH